MKAATVFISTLSTTNIFIYIYIYIQLYIYNIPTDNKLEIWKQGCKQYVYMYIFIHIYIYIYIHIYIHIYIYRHIYIGLVDKVLPFTDTPVGLHHNEDLGKRISTYIIYKYIFLSYELQFYKH
jgi:hypothetical protein